VSNYPLAALQLGNLFAERDQQEKAIVYLKKYIEWDSNAGTEAYTELACSYIRLGNMAEAQEVADLCRMKHPDDFFAPFLAAWIAAKRGHVADALCHITDSVSLDPLWPVPLGLRGLIFSQAGDFETAKRVLYEMVAVNGGVYASGLAPEERLNANRLWRKIRQNAKCRLGLRPSESAHFIGLYGGLGDQFLTAIYLSAFKTFNNDLPLIVLSTARAQWERLFPDSADLFFHIEKDELHQLLACNRFFPITYIPLSSHGSVTSVILSLGINIRGSIWVCHRPYAERNRTLRATLDWRAFNGFTALAA